MHLDIEGQRLAFSGEELEVAVEALEGFAAETGQVGVVVLHTTLTDALVDEGIVRELVSRVQAARKDLQLAFTDRIAVRLAGTDRALRVAREHEDHIKRECLAVSVELGAAGEDAREHAIGEESVRLSVTKV